MTCAANGVCSFYNLAQLPSAVPEKSDALQDGTVDHRRQHALSATTSATSPRLSNPRKLS